MITLTFVLLLISLTKKSNIAKKSYKFISLSLGYFHITVVGLGVVITIYTVQEVDWLYVLNNPGSSPGNFSALLIALSILNYAIVVLMQLIVHPKIVFETLLAIVAYMFYTPSFYYVFPFYNFCNFDDLSWGTKGIVS